MRANVIQVYPFNIDKVKLLTMRGAPGAKGPKGDPGNFQLDQLVPTNSAAGSIASFADGGNDLPVKDLKVNIQPSQDLHGYSNPWPEGGGKNVFPVATATSSGASNIFNNYSISLPAGTYTLSFKNNGTRSQAMTVSFSMSGGSSVSQNIYSSSTSATFVASADITALTWYVREATNISEIQLELGSTATTYAPYSNICPITGWENVKVTRTGKNLWNPHLYTGINYNVSVGTQITLSDSAEQLTDNGNGVFTLSTSATWKGYCFVIPVKTGVSYRLTFSITTTGTTGTTWGYLDKDNKVLTSTYSTTVTQNKAETLTPPEGAKFYYLMFTNRTTASETITITQPRLELGTTASEYEPYTAAEVTISLGSTVYGGTLDVTSGVLTVDRAMVDIGMLTWETIHTGSTRKAIRTSLPSAYPGYPNQTLDMVQTTYKFAGYVSSASGLSSPDSKDLGFYMYRNTTNTTPQTIYMVVDSNATPSGTLVYKIATPTTVQLTPAQLNTLLGVNNIWSDAGDTSVEYYANTKLYIDLAGQTEDDMTANANIASGRYFQIGNTLYISTAAIAAGETIVPGTNCRKTTIAEALNALL